MPQELQAGTFDPLHDIDLKKGKFTTNTGAGDLGTAFRKFETDYGAKHLCIFFHGGLVDYDSGLQAATKLLPDYSSGGTYPFFFIWHSGLLQAISDLIKGYEDDQGFVTAANYAVDGIAAKMEAALDTDKTLKAYARRRARARKGRLRTLRELAAYAEPYDRAWGRRPDVQIGCSSRELERFADFLIKTRRGRRGKGATFRGVSLRAAKGLYSRIHRRFNTHHDHGLYTTIVEELLITLGVSGLASDIWNEMKAYIDDSFAQDAQAGGTVFLERLAEAYQQNPNVRITLIGHSAGSIYVQRFIEELDARFGNAPALKVEVIYMAPALSVARMYAGLEAFRRRVSALRLFALTNDTEGSYWEVPFIYNKSLLYIVSGLCEEDPDADKPLIGMQRYWSGKPPYCGADIQAVTVAIDLNRTVWAPTDDADPGYGCGAEQHGGFPLDPTMRDSVKYMLVNGI